MAKNEYSFEKPALIEEKGMMEWAYADLAKGKEKWIIVVIAKSSTC